MAESEAENELEFSFKMRGDVAQTFKEIHTELTKTEDKAEHASERFKNMETALKGTGSELNKFSGYLSGLSEQGGRFSKVSAKLSGPVAALGKGFSRLGNFAGRVAGPIGAIAGPVGMAASAFSFLNDQLQRAVELNRTVANWQTPQSNLQQAMRNTSLSAGQAESHFDELRQRIEEASETIGVSIPKMSSAMQTLAMKTSDAEVALANVDRVIAVSKTWGTDLQSAAGAVANAYNRNFGALAKAGILSGSEAKKLAEMADHSRATAKAIELLDEKTRGYVANLPESAKAADRFDSSLARLKASLAESAPVEGVTSGSASVMEWGAGLVEDWNRGWDNAEGGISGMMKRVDRPSKLSAVSSTTREKKTLEEGHRRLRELEKNYRAALAELDAQTARGELLGTKPEQRELELDVEFAEARQKVILEYEMAPGAVPPMSQIEQQLQASWHQASLLDADGDKERFRLQTDRMLSQLAEQRRRALEGAASLSERGQLNDLYDQRRQNMRRQRAQQLQDQIVEPARQRRLARYRRSAVAKVQIELLDTEDPRERAELQRELALKQLKGADLTWRERKYQKARIDQEFERRNEAIDKEEQAAKRRAAIAGKQLTLLREEDELSRAKLEHTIAIAELEARVESGNLDQGSNQYKLEKAKIDKQLDQREKAIEKEEASAARRKEVAQQRLNLLEVEDPLLRAKLEHKIASLELEGREMSAIERKYERQRLLQEYAEERKEQLHQREMERVEEQIAAQKALTDPISEAMQFSNNQAATGGGKFVSDLQSISAEFQTMRAEGKGAAEAMEGSLSAGGAATAEFLEAMGLGFREVAGVRALFETGASIAAFASGNIPGGIGHATAASIFAGMAITGAGAPGKSGGASGGGAPSTATQSSGLSARDAFESQKRAHLEALRESRQESRSTTIIFDQSGSTFLERDPASVRRARQVLDSTDRLRLSA